MARLSRREPYSKIIIFDEEYIIQFKVIEKQSKVECLIFIDDELYVRGVSKCNLLEDTFDINKGKEIALNNALFKMEEKFQNFAQEVYYTIHHRKEYIVSQIHNKCTNKKHKGVNA